MQQFTLPCSGMALGKCATKLTVLVVDDNREIRRWISQSFLSDGFSICGEAENGQEAIDLATQILPDLIILDLSMPVMNGLQAATELRKLAPKAPIILFTMFVSDEVKARAYQLGIDLVLSKSEALSSLLDKAHSLIVGDTSDESGTIR